MEWFAEVAGVLNLEYGDADEEGRIKTKIKMAEDELIKRCKHKTGIMAEADGEVDVSHKMCSRGDKIRIFLRVGDADEGRR